MASIDDVYRVTNMMLDALVRTGPEDMTQGMGQVGSFPGLAPRTYRAAAEARRSSAQILTVVTETNALLNAVNVETLGRIEARANDSQGTLALLQTAINDGRSTNDRALAVITSDLAQIMDFLVTVREDMAALGTQLDQLKAEVQALPH
jgi:hypothetical protein